MNTLYHASPKKDLKMITPKRTLSKDIYIGDYVFATSDKRLAAMYLATKGVAILLNTDYELPTIVICDDPKNYLLKDKGGAIYTVSAASFKKTPQIGLEKYEMVSKAAVQPIDKIIYTKSLDAMREMDIVIYFVDQTVFNKLVEAKDERHILEKLQPFTQ
jgi:hypothetical protein